jgi:hypothetical protein
MVNASKDLNNTSHLIVKTGTSQQINGEEGEVGLAKVRDDISVRAGRISMLSTSPFPLAQMFKSPR